MTTVDKQPHGDYGPHGPGSVHSGYSGAPPPSHQTVVTMTTDPQAASVTEINLNIAYFKTMPGYIKVIQLVRNLIFLKFEGKNYYFKQQRVVVIEEF